MQALVQYWNAENSLQLLFSFIALIGREFANDLGDQGSIPGRVITKDFKNGTWYLLA